MQRKRPRRQAIDNFIPSGRTIGTPVTRQRFPDVGMTLSSYRGTLGTIPASAPPAGAGLKAKRRRKRWSKKRIALVILIPLIVLGIWIGSKFFYDLAQIFHGNIFGIFGTTRLKGEDEGRVNILLAGNSADDPGHNGANLTDSIMIISINTRDNTAFMLSVPRDLYVDIPGNGRAKINEAYVDGQNSDFSAPGYPDGGMGLLEQVIEQNLGIKSDYYALINYAAFRDAVNAVGGINVNIQSSDPRGLYDPDIDWTTHGPLVRLSNGEHTLNGEQALDLARARGDAYGSYGFGQIDFARTQNQRMMLLALKRKAASAGVLANPFKLTNLLDALGKNVRTDMTISEAKRAYQLVGGIGNSKIKSYALNSLNGKNYLTSTRYYGQDVLIPAAGLDDFSDIKAALAKLTSNSQVSQESANIVVLNGTNTNGLASRTETALEGRSLDITAIGDASQLASQTYIINVSHGTKPATLRLLKQLYGNHVSTNDPYRRAYSSADFIIVLGSDRLAYDS